MKDAYEYQLVEINSLSYKEALSFLKDNILQLKKNRITHRQLLSKIGTHPEILSKMSDFLSNKPFEYLDKELFTELDSIANQQGLENVMTLIQKKKYNQLSKFGFAYRKIINFYIVPICVLNWYQEKKKIIKQSEDKINVFVSYCHDDKEKVYKIVRVIENSLSQNIIIHVDEQQLHAGNKIRTWIHETIKISQTSIIFYGQNVNKYQDYEIDALIDKTISCDSFKIIPVIIKGGLIHNSLKEHPLKDIKRVDFNNNKINSIEAIIKALNSQN